VSSILVIKQRDCINVITDGASYSPDGILATISTKVGVMPHLNALVYTRGPSNTAILAAVDMGGSFTNFDDIIEHLEEFAPDFYERHTSHFINNAFPEIELYVCGWSTKRSAPEGYLIRCCFADSSFHDNPEWLSAGGTYTAAPFKMQTLSKLCASPKITPEEMKQTKFPSHLEVEELDPKIDGLHLFHIQRSKIGTRPDQVNFHAVGGFAMLTTIRENEITQSILKRFNDKVGEPITPEPMDWNNWNKVMRPVAAPLSFMTRQQRRALGRGHDRH
jgi:hypothetical protein